LSKEEVPLTPLQYACVHGQIVIAQLLFEHNTKLDILDKKGRSLVTLAAENDHYDLARLMIEHGATTQIISTILLEDITRIQTYIKEIGGINKMLRSLGYGHSILHIAVLESLLSLVEWLLNNGADPMLIDDFRQTPIQLACITGNIEI